MIDKARKNDTNKPRFDLVPPRALREVAQVMTHGAEKYSDWNYLKGDGLKAGRYVAATIRHINAFQCGEDNDAEWDLHHLAHAAASILMALEELRVHGQQSDDRFYREVPVEISVAVVPASSPKKENGKWAPDNLPGGTKEEGARW